MSGQELKNNILPPDEQEELSEEKITEQRRIRREKLRKLQELGRNPFLVEAWDVDAHSMNIKNNYEAYEGKTVTVAGRIMANRHMGKASFIDIQDKLGRIQCYVRQDVIGPEEYEIFVSYDIGDIVGISGEVFTTRHGEISVKAEKVVLLTKSLQVLPNKFQGLKDTDIRYRQRYVDLIVNPEVRETFITRARIIKEIKRYLEEEKGFLEVDTPILTTIAGGANARPFSTHHNTLDLDMKLRISNELYLKRLIVGGLDRVYEMGKMFRNEGMDRNHNPEFTSMELYQAYGDMEDMMEITENVIASAAMKVLGTTVLEYQGKTFDVKPPWARITMQEAVKKWVGVDFDQIQTDEDAREVARKYHLEDADTLTRGLVIAELFEEYCEEHLEGPIFVIGHPVEISPLSKRDPIDPRITRRFEAYINCWEVANAFSELNDPIDQYQRFKEQQAQLDAGTDEEAHPMDEDYVNALEVGLPPTGGLGIGIDRVIMLITNAPSIRDIILFPTMKPIGAEKPEKKTAEGLPEAAPKPEERIDFSKVKVEPLFDDCVDFDTFSKSDFRAVKVKECVAVPKSKKLLQFTLDDGTGTDRTILSGIHEYYEPEELIGKTCIAITNLPPRPMMGVESCGMLISAVHEEEGAEKLHLLMVDDHIPAGAKLY